MLEALDAEGMAKKKSDWARGVWEMILRDTAPMLDFFGAPTVDILPPEAKPGELLATAETAFDRLKSTLDPAQLGASGPEGDAARKQLGEFTTPAIKLGRLCHEELYWCDRYASMINYRYWKERTAAESERSTVDARRHFYNGMKSFQEGDLETARREFEQGLKLWQEILDKFQRMREDDITAEETVKIVKTYQAVCQQLDIELAQDQLPFQDYLRRYAPQVQLSPEEYEMMRKSVQEFQQSSPEEMEAKKKEFMEKFGDRLKLKQ
jgi:hypothetical protein